MKSGLEAVAIVVLTFLLSLSLGIAYGGSGLPGTSGNSVQKTPPRSFTISAPKFILRAEGVSPGDLYESSFYSTIPSSMMVPLSGLHVTLAQAAGASSINRQRPRPSTLTTNSSGLLQVFIPPANYSVLVEGPNFLLGANFSISINETATLNLQLHPTAENVKRLSIVSPDTVNGVESGASMFALLNYSSNLSPGFAELVGARYNYTANQFVYVGGNSVEPVQVSATVLGPIVAVNATLLGLYPGSGGDWAVLSPIGSYAAYPSTGVLLFQYEPIYRVTYTAG
jgi:hypothetical protein